MWEPHLSVLLDPVTAHRGRARWLHRAIETRVCDGTSWEGLVAPPYNGDTGLEKPRPQDAAAGGDGAGATPVGLTAARAAQGPSGGVCSAEVPGAVWGPRRSATLRPGSSPGKPGGVCVCGLTPADVCAVQPPAGALPAPPRACVGDSMAEEPGGVPGLLEQTQKQSAHVRCNPASPGSVPQTG